MGLRESLDRALGLSGYKAAKPAPDLRRFVVYAPLSIVALLSPPCC